VCKDHPFPTPWCRTAPRLTNERFPARLYAEGAGPFSVVEAFALATLLGRRWTTQDLDL
jgi:hypothetical protein